MREETIIEVWRLELLTVIANNLCQWALALTWVRSKESICIAIATGTANFANFATNFAIFLKIKSILAMLWQFGGAFICIE